VSPWPHYRITSLNTERLPWLEAAGPSANCGPGSAQEKPATLPVSSVAERVRISIVIPSFNQGEFIEETLQSIFTQEGAEYEVLVLDGGSTDETTDVLKRSSEQLVYWVSAPDSGQSHAINKGLERMTGDVWMYLNSDDLLVPGALAAVANYFADSSVMWVAGGSSNFGNAPLGGVNPGPAHAAKDYLAPWNRRSRYVFPFSGACFMRRAVLERIGFFDESFQYSMDIEYYCRAIFRGGFYQTVVPEIFALWRWHGESKTMSRGIAYGFRSEEVRIAQLYAQFLPIEQQAELQAELKLQKKWIVVREAMWLLQGGKRREAYALISRAPVDFPSMLFFRPWLGALRRMLVSTL
jgi:glycosyltransferase involved in cell wall biosynthesis